MRLFTKCDTNDGWGELLINDEQKNNEPPVTDRPKVGRFLLRTLWDVVSTIVPAVLIVLVINVFVVQAMTIDGPSMQPNLYYDQRVMIEKVTCRFIHGPRRGDVVTFDAPGEPDQAKSNAIS